MNKKTIMMKTLLKNLKIKLKHFVFVQKVCFIDLL